MGPHHFSASRPGSACRLSVALVLAFGAAGVMAQDPPSSSSAQFRSDVQLVLLPITARDSGGRIVTDLVAADFRIFENGRPQQVALFSSEQLPIALALLLDTSGSMQPRLAFAQQAAISIIDRLRPDDVGQVIQFNHSVQINQDFTSDPALLRSAIRQTSAGGSTSLFNAIYIALRSLQHQRPRQDAELRREAIIVLSDGDDTTSLVLFDEVLEAAKRSHTVIYTISLKDPRVAMRTDGAYVMRRLADETGGRPYTISDVRRLDGIYQEIYETIAGSYMIGYMPNAEAPKPGWRSVAVAVGRPGVVARTRSGYFGE